MLDKTKTYTPKEALDADPDWTIPVKLGRGRMPKGGDEHCRALAGKGYRIKGYTLSTVTPTSGDKSTAPVVNKSKPVAEKIVAEYTLVYDESAYKAVTVENKTYGMREVCNKCRVSLVQCHCGDPVILGDIPVKIVLR